MPAMQVHYRPRHVFLNSRKAPFLARLDSVDDTDFFLENIFAHFNEKLYALVSSIIPLNRFLVSLLISLILILFFLSVCALA